MKEKLQALEAEAVSRIRSASTSSEVEGLRVHYLGRKGEVTACLRAMADLSPDERPAMGRVANEVKTRIEAALADREKEVAGGEVAARFAAEALDPTRPGRTRFAGSLHPLTLVVREILDIFVRMGFGVAEGPEAETEYYNFEALNIPADHPARDMQDTFFISRNVLLRTHTSPVQTRIMETTPPPVRVIIPGRVYRNEAISARSYCLFHQVEGLYVDRGVTFAELKSTLVAFARQFYGSDQNYRFRPSFFPFTEPSAEMDITCFLCRGKGCRVCKKTGWLEILGCGMVDPNVYGFVGYDPSEYSGYAFGMGIERITMLRYGLDDIRVLFENDVRFLRQFP